MARVLSKRKGRQIGVKKKLCGVVGRRRSSQRQRNDGEEPGQWYDPADASYEEFRHARPMQQRHRNQKPGKREKNGHAERRDALIDPK